MKCGYIGCWWMIADSDAGKIKVAKLSDKITAMTDCGGKAKMLCRRNRAFTLIELMAVVLVILILAAIGMGVAGYVQKKVAIATTKSQIAAIEAALESYKSDWGYYPPTNPWRVSNLGGAELLNNQILYRALFVKGGKRYLTFPANQLQASYWGTGALGGQRDTLATNVLDVYGRPFNYYCSPNTPFSLSSVILTNLPIGQRTNSCSLGGQVNVASYDLFSYGPDKFTFVATNATTWPAYFSGRSLWYTNSSAIDDVTNWQP